MSKILLKNIFAYNNKENSFYKTSLLIEDGKVIEQNEITKKYDEIIDGTERELYLVPGFFDLSMRISGLDHTSQVSLDSEVDKIAKSGITSALLLPDVSPNIDNIQILNDIQRRLENLTVKFYPIASITKKDNDEIKISEIFSLIDEGAIGFSDINKPIESSEFLYNALNYTSMVNKKIIKVSKESGFDDGPVNDGKISDKWGLLGNLDISESISAFKTISVAKKLNNQLHLNSISTKEALDVIKNFKDKMYNFSVDTSPMYFAINEDVLLDNLSPKFKIFPPLRTEKDRVKVIEAIKDGLIDVVTSGHKLNSPTTKNVDFENASFGTSSAYTFFPSISEYLYHQNGISKEKIVDLVSIKPRELFNISIPKIEVNSSLEHILLDFDEEFIFKADKEKENLNIFSNKKMRGIVSKVFINNKIFN